MTALLMLAFITIALSLTLILHLIFFMLGKTAKFNFMEASSFECGFSPYFNARTSFSIHYYSVALIFLIFDLEVCFIFPFLNETSNKSSSIYLFMLFTLMMLAALGLEWMSKKIQWKDI